jgi:hypothetical protein
MAMFAASSLTLVLGCAPTVSITGILAPLEVPEDGEIVTGKGTVEEPMKGVACTVQAHPGPVKLSTKVVLPPPGSVKKF